MSKLENLSDSHLRIDHFKKEAATEIRCSACKNWSNSKSMIFIDGYPICSECRAEYSVSQLSKKIMQP